MELGSQTLTCYLHTLKALQSTCVLRELIALKTYLLVQVTHNVVQRGLIITVNLFAIGTMALFLSTLLNPIVRVGDQRKNILYLYMRHCCLEASS